MKIPTKSVYIVFYKQHTFYLLGCNVGQLRSVEITAIFLFIREFTSNSKGRSNYERISEATRYLRSEVMCLPPFAVTLTSFFYCFVQEFNIFQYDILHALQLL